MNRKNKNEPLFRECFVRGITVREQGEEEKNADDLIKKYKMFGSDAKGLYALNQELLARTYVAPTLVL